MKNRLSLTTILGIFLSGFVIVGVTWCHYMGQDLVAQERFRDDNLYFQIFTGFFLLTLLGFFTVLGVFYKSNWSRAILLWLFYIGLIATGIIFVFNLGTLTRNYEEFIAGIGMFVFAVSLLLGGILFLNSKVVKEEFGEKNDLG